MKEVLPYGVFWVAGLVSSAFSKIADYYYNSSPREQCKTDIPVPCLDGVFERVGIIALGWVLSLIVIYVFMSKSRAKRKWFVCILGSVSFWFLGTALSSIFGYEITSSFFIGPLLYLIAYGSQYFIFSKLLK